MTRLLHTSDWHVGKAVRGHSRADEHRAVLAEIASIVEHESVELVLVAGDLFETAAPSPEAEQIVYRALLDLTRSGATVAVVAGNHDNAQRLRAVAPLLELGRVHLVTEPRSPTAGGVSRVELPSGDEVSLAMLPFVSQRGIVSVNALMGGAALEHAQTYTQRLGALVGHLCSALADDVPSVLLAHAFVLGGATGGGERRAHLVEEYAVVSQSFPATVGYVALGHLHRAQKVPGGTAIHYCGSPLQLDFGETHDVKQVNVVDLVAGKPAKVTAVELTSGCPMVTLAGTVEHIGELAVDVDPRAWIRARVDEPRRAGLADELRGRLGPMGERVVDVLIEGSAPDTPTSSSRRDGRAPRELFAEFLASRDVVDERLRGLFDDLHDQAVSDEASS